MTRILHPAPLVFLILLLLAGCCAPRKQPLESQLPVHYLYTDGLDLTWREDQSSPTFYLYGVLRNFHPMYLQNLVMDVDFLDDQGKVIETHTINNFPLVIKPRQEVPFKLEYPPPPGRRGERAIFRFSYFLPNPMANDYKLYEELAFLCCDTVKPVH